MGLQDDEGRSDHQPAAGKSNRRNRLTNYVVEEIGFGVVMGRENQPLLGRARGNASDDIFLAFSAKASKQGQAEPTSRIAGTGIRSAETPPTRKLLFHSRQEYTTHDEYMETQKARFRMASGKRKLGGPRPLPGAGENGVWPSVSRHGNRLAYQRGIW